ncbi:hypothetical protein CFN78_02570 [Amycolatopsis antarctica]|uniref:Alpha-1,2-mannosyltransferase n=1 Tax=Amycolatopsis antarctica TaxID=1854586 RepID=A0A263D9V8_9PSEU|nr:hypothetical protein CFN78_02570 [Amycolatopsis antarctica]
MLVLGTIAWAAAWRIGADSAVYRAGALTLLRGEPLYDLEPLATLPDWVRLPFTYPPAAALLFVPLAAVPEGLAWGVLGAVSVLALAVTIRVCARDSCRWSRWGVVAALTVAALALEPVWKTLFLGQINLILMALVVVDVLVVCAPGRSSRWGGVLVGVAAAVKLTPLIFVAHLLFTGRWRDALRGLGTFVALQGLMFALIPGDVAKYWTQAVSDPERVGSVHWIFNQSLNGLLARLSGGASWAGPAAIGIGAALAVPAVWLVVRLYRRGEALPALLVTAAYGLLLSPVSWSHHWVWAVPLAVWLLGLGRYRLAVAVTAFFLIAVIMFVPNGAEAEFDWGPIAFTLGNAYVLAAAGVLLAAAVRERLRLSAGAPR